MKTLFVASLVSLSFVANAKDTIDTIYNPEPASDDVVISMPCNGQMVFKKIYTSSDPKKIKDKKFNAGSITNNSPLSQNPTIRYVQGSLKDDKGYYYLMAKYELLKGQYESLMHSDKCPAVNKSMRFPAVKISYFDAISAAHNYSLYLQTASDAIVFEDQKAFVRLATDEEWEFAARGGTVVTQGQFEANLPPMDKDDLNAYAWFQGSQSANGRIQLAGLKKPNPLGLYDMFGNAQEMTLEPFKAVRTGRLLGQAGAISVRGGSYLTSRASISSAYRSEKPYFNPQGQDLSTNDTSTRFVIGLSVATSVHQVQQLNQEIQSLGNELDTESASLSKIAKALATQEELNAKTTADFNKQKEELEQQNKALNEEKSNLAQNADKLGKLNGELVKFNENLSKSNKELNSQLIELKNNIIEANGKNDDLVDVAVSANLRLGGFLCQNLKTEKKNIVYFENIAKVAKDFCTKDPKRCEPYEKAKKSVEDHESSLRILSTYYADTIAGATSNYTVSKFKTQLPDAKSAFGSDKAAFSKFIDTYFDHLSTYKNQDKKFEVNKNKWIEQCASVN